MGKTHFLLVEHMWDSLRCGSKRGEGTNALEHVTCKNCLKLMGQDLKKALAKVEVKEKKPTGFRCYLTYEQTYEYLIKEFMEMREFIVIGRQKRKQLDLEYIYMHINMILWGLQTKIKIKEKTPETIMEIELLIQESHAGLHELYKFRRECFGEKTQVDKKLKEILEG